MFEFDSTFATDTDTVKNALTKVTAATVPGPGEPGGRDAVVRGTVAGSTVAGSRGTVAREGASVPGSVTAQVPRDTVPTDIMAEGRVREVRLLLEGLNPQQLEAVTYEEGHSLVVAGAGSGKTRVVTYRIAYLLAKGLARPSQILAITFTNKAAKEMKERVEKLLGESARWMWVSTFHSFCVRLLRKYHDLVGLTSSFSIYDQSDSRTLIKQLMQEASIDTKKFSPTKVQNHISYLKNKPKLQEKETNRKLSEEEAIAHELLGRYNSRLRATNATDFDGLLTETVRLLEQNPAVRVELQQKFRYIFVDEYQDTNPVQFRLVQLLVTKAASVHPTYAKVTPPNPSSNQVASDEPTLDQPFSDQYTPEQTTPEDQTVTEPATTARLPLLTVVGDADQSIYAFRGATIRNIDAFTKDFQGAKTFALEQNYRSTQTILEAANQVIKENPDRFDKTLWTSGPKGQKITVYTTDNQFQEADAVARSIAELLRTNPNEQIAIIYRMNSSSRVLEEQLLEWGIAYEIVGGTKFYDRREIKDLLAYLQLACNNFDAVSFNRIVNVPKRSLGPKAVAEIFATLAGEEYSLAELIHGVAHGEIEAVGALKKGAYNKFKQFCLAMVKLQELMLADTALVELLDYIYQDIGYSKYLLEQDKAEIRQDNVSELYNIAASFQERLELGEIEPLTPDQPLLASFLEFVSLTSDTDTEQGQEQQQAPANLPVTLLTAHAAKGLEFTSVYVVGMEEGVFPHERSYDEEGGLAEERRLCYVAFTRAKQRLYLTRALTRLQWGKQSYNEPSRYLADIPPELKDEVDLT